MTEQDKENTVATINGMSEEELQIVVTCIPDELLGMEIISRLQEARDFKRGILELLSTKKIAP